MFEQGAWVNKATNGNGHASGNSDATELLMYQQELWFETFWDEYWLKKSKKPAWEAFQEHVRTEERFQVVIAAVRAQSSEMEDRKIDGRTPPYAANWLNDERWEDELQ